MLDDFKNWLEITSTLGGDGVEAVVSPEYHPLIRNSSPRITLSKKYNKIGLGQETISAALRNKKMISQSSTNKMAARDPMRHIPH